MTSRLGRVASGLRRRPAGNTNTSPGAASALVVPVPDATRATAAWPGEADRLTAAGMPFHVTVLYPFLAPEAIDEEVERALEKIAGGTTRFGFSLAELGRFEQVLFMAPRPADPFVALTRAVHEHWPEHPPYGGEFETVIPHVTLASGPEPEGLASAVESRLPIETEALELWLLTPRSHGAWATRNRFALGSDRSGRPAPAP
ncbi:MAG TPA: 2'-5' RNA ligase family protein [Solirubrobacteraceae bacterium]